MAHGSPDTIRTLTLGDHAPSFELPATDGRTYSLRSFRDKPHLVVIFLSLHCPYVAAWEDRIVAIPKEHTDHEFAFIAINSSDVTKSPQEGIEQLRKRAEEQGYPFPYLYDQDQSVARALGARRTPEVFVFDQDRLLVYHGAVDSDYEESSATRHYLREALTRLRTWQKPSVPETPVVGCPIKWKS